MIIGSLLLAKLILYHMTTAAVYNYNETSEEIPYEHNPTFIRGFRNITGKDFIIAGMFSVYSSRCNTPGVPEINIGLSNLETLEAMLFAIDRINNDMNLLPNLTIGYDVRESCNDDLTGIFNAFDIVVEYVNEVPAILGVIGPANVSVNHAVANILGLEYIEVPLVSYALSDVALSNKDLYKTFLRTIPSDSLQARAMVDLVSYFGWDYVSVIFSDNEYGDFTSNAFIDGAEQNNICLDARISVPLSSGTENSQALVRTAVRTLLNSTASVVAVFTDEAIVLALFEELNKTNSTRNFVWIASDRWANSRLVQEMFPDIAKGTFAFQLYTKHVEELADYLSQLTPTTNIRDPFFPFYYEILCGANGNDCLNGSVTNEPSYSQGILVPFVIDAVYVLAHALQNFLDDNCDSPLRWDLATQRCDGMLKELNGENLLSYAINVTFNSIQNHTVSFDENGDPSGIYEITHLRLNGSGHYEYVSIGFWNSAYKEIARLILNNTNEIMQIDSRCSEPCSEGMIRSITNQNCLSCFECIPCFGPTYSMNSTSKNCSLCSDNHWGNNPLLGSTHCVPIKVRHLDFSSGWSIVSMCMASIALIILAVVTVIFVIYWNTPVVKSTDREQMVMLLVAIGISCTLTYIIVAPPSTVVCAFQRIGVWFCFSLAFGALLVKIVRIARIFYSIKNSLDSPSFSDRKYQVMFTVAIVFFQLILVVIGLIVDHPVVKRDPEVVVTSTVQQIGNAPEIIETCQQSHTAILVISLVYNSVLIVGCTILGWMTRKFPDNFNEAEHVMFTSFTLMVVWVLFVPLYFYTERELQIGVLTLGIVLSAIALMAGVFFPRVYILVFQRNKNTTEYVKQQSHLYVVHSTKMLPFQQRNSANGEGTHDQGTIQIATIATNQNVHVSRDSFMKPAAIPMSNHGKSPDKGTSTSDSGVVTSNSDDTIKEKHYQPESDMNSSCV